jgi:hypothetical protein
MLAFTYCQVPVVYQLAPAPFLTVAFTDGRKQRQRTLVLNADISRTVFKRANIVKSITVGISL